MMKVKNKSSVYVALFFIILVCNCIMLSIFAGKSDIHIDEIWSYSLSNSHEKPFLFTWQAGLGEIGSESRNYKIKEGEDDPFTIDKDNYFYEQWHSGKEFHDYLTVQKNERFDYANVYYNQTCDVHPPLYYFLLHTVCSFFPDRFSIWYAASINLLFFSLSLIALFFLGRQVLKSDNKALLAAAVWGMSRAGLSNAAFLRMYMLMTFFIIMLAYFHMRLIKEYKHKYVALIFLINIAGFLTQYYFYIFSFFITASVCFYLLYKKRIKQLLIYAFSVLASVGAALLVFPATIVHLTQGVYTENTFDGMISMLDGGSGLLVDILQDYTGLTYYRKTSFADLLIIIVSFTAFVLWLRICKKKIDNKESILSVFKNIDLKKFDPGYTILLISLILSGFVIEKLSPSMPYFNDRYIFGLLPLFALPFVSIACFAAQKAAVRFKREKYAFAAAAAVLALFLVLSNTLNENKYFGKTRNSEEINNIIAQATDGGTFYYIAKREYIIHIFSAMFENADRVYAAHDLDEKSAEVINKNEIGVKSAYILFEAPDVIIDDREVIINRREIDMAMQENIKHDYEFVTDFYFGNNIRGDVYHLYRIDY